MAVICSLSSVLCPLTLMAHPKQAPNPQAIGTSTETSQGIPYWIDNADTAFNIGVGPQVWI